jgi:transposase InsO family protein
MAKVGAVGSWPAFGRMRNVYTDNGQEFRSLSFRLGCKRQKIDNGYRPVRTPRYGGVIERLLGTIKLHASGRPFFFLSHCISLPRRFVIIYIMRTWWSRPATGLMELADWSAQQMLTHYQPNHDASA